MLLRFGKCCLKVWGKTKIRPEPLTINCECDDLDSLDSPLRFLYENFNLVKVTGESERDTYYKIFPKVRRVRGYNPYGNN